MRLNACISRSSVAKSMVMLLCASLTLLSSCLGNDDEDYSEWKQQNEKYLAEMEQKADFTRLSPPWAPDAFVFVKWLNDRSKTAKNLSPLDNSVCNVKYILRNIEGDSISSSYKSTAYGDSIYQTRPLNNIIGFWYTLTNMRVGDKVTAVMPPSAAYGTQKYGDIKPYSVLVYEIELVSIPAYVVPKK